LISHSFSVRDTLGRLCGKGHVLAIARGEGIYETDVACALGEIRFRRGEEEADVNETARSLGQIVSQLATRAVAVRSASAGKLPVSEIDREFSLLQFQFRDRNAFLTALRTSGLSEQSLRKIISGNLRARHWIDRQVETQVRVTAEECVDFYKEHSQDFSQPARLHVSHLFLAAPPETPPEIVDLKKERIEGLAERVKAGESLSDLIAVESEDEATKARGGDLGCFAASRMPEDFFRAAEKLRPGETSGPVQTALGFHIIRAIDRKPAEQLSLDQAREEIMTILAGAKRLVALRKFDVDLASQVRFRPGF